MTTKPSALDPDKSADAAFNLTHSRWVVVLAGLLVIQAALIVLVYWPSGAAGEAGAPLLGEVSAEDVSSVAITDAREQTVTLARSDDGWVLAGSGYSVLESEVSTLLDKVTGLTSDRLVGSTDATREQLEVSNENFVRRVELSLDEGDTQTLYLGSSPRVNAIHVRLDGQDQVYLALGLGQVDAEASVSSWIDTSYLSLPREQITQITLQNSNGEFVFNKDDNGEWQFADLEEGEEANSANISTIATTLSSLNMAEPLGTEAESGYGLDDPNAVVTAVTQSEDGEEQTHTLTIGRAVGDGNRYVVSSSDSEWLVEVNSSSVERLVQRGRADFVTVPETPTPAVETTPTAP